MLTLFGAEFSLLKSVALHSLSAVNHLVRNYKTTAETVAGFKDELGMPPAFKEFGAQVETKHRSYTWWVKNRRIEIVALGKLKQCCEVSEKEKKIPLVLPRNAS